MCAGFIRFTVAAINEPQPRPKVGFLLLGVSGIFWNWGLMYKKAWKITRLLNFELSKIKNKILPSAPWNRLLNGGRDF